jgi:hypothetical protein
MDNFKAIFELVKSDGKAGVEVVGAAAAIFSGDDIVKNILKNQDLSLGTIVKKNPSPIAQARGKSTTRFSTVAKTKEIISTDQFDIYESKILFKDVTNVLAKAEGKTPSMRGYTKVFQEPIILDTEPVNFVSFKGSKKTPFSKTFEQVEEQVKVELVEIPKPVPKTPKQAKTKVIFSKTSSTINGKLGILSGSLSGYAYGFDSSSSYTSDFLRGFQDYSKISKTSAQPKEKGILKVEPLSLQKNIPSVAGVEKQINSNITKSISKNIPKEIPREVPREATKEVQKEVQKELQKELAKLLSKQTSKSIKNPTKELLFRRPSKKGSYLDSGFSRDNKKAQGIFGQGYKTYFLSKGKKIYYPGIRGKGEALAFGQSKTLKNLTATFGVEKSNSIIKVTNNLFKPNSKLFRNYKIVKGKAVELKDVYIQKRGQRLYTDLERKLIQQARKKKKKYY